MENNKGDCIIVSCKNVVENKDFLFCYAMVKGNGEYSGKRILHAWNEHQDVVFDYSNGRKIIMRKEKYYKLANIKEKNVKKQTAKEVMILMLKHRSYGGWINEPEIK